MTTLPAARGTRATREGRQPAAFYSKSNRGFSDAIDPQNYVFKAFPPDCEFQPGDSVRAVDEHGEIYTGRVVDSARMIQNQLSVGVLFDHSPNMVMVAVDELCPVLSADEQTTLEQHEAFIAQHIKAFIEVGNRLAEIRDRRLYRAEFKTWQEYAQTRWDMTGRYANKLIEASTVVSNLGTIVPKLPENEAQTRPLTALEPEEQRLAWEVVTKTAPDGKVTAAHVKSVVNVVKEILETGAVDDGTGDEIPTKQATVEHLKAAVTEETFERMQRQQAHIRQAAEIKAKADPLMSSESVEWYTPDAIVQRVIKVMGTIDLDPCSNSAKYPNVPAKLHYTIVEDGLKQEWHGRVYMNPPYGRDIGDWIVKVLEQHTAGNTTQALLLLPARTDTKWFQLLKDFPRCFLHGRLKFSGSENSATFPNVVVNIGCDRAAFIQVFGEIGDVYERVTV